MENDVKHRILETIALATSVRDKHLNPDNPDALGYGYVAGYLSGAINEIQRLAKLLP